MCHALAMPNTDAKDLDPKLWKQPERIITSPDSYRLDRADGLAYAIRYGRGYWMIISWAAHSDDDYIGPFSNERDAKHALARLWEYAEHKDGYRNALAEYAERKAV